MSLLNLSARLDRTDSQTSWGFRMHGGKDFSLPLTIQRVTPGSLAAKCGLQVGDTILKIGSTPTDGLFHKDAQNKIISSGNSLELALQRGGSAGLSRPSQHASAPAGSYSPSSYQQPQQQQQQQQQSASAFAPVNQPGGHGQPSYNTTPKPFGGQAANSMPVAVNKQYNTPIDMYSVGNVMDTLATQTSNINVGQSDPSPPWRHDSGAGRSPHGGGGYKGPGTAAPGSKATWQPKVPTGDRKMRVGKAGEARSMGAPAGGRIPTCSSCGVVIRGPFVMALDKTWCPNHFNCGNPNCRTPLIDQGFVEEEGQIYCVRDYEQYFAPKCHKCGSAIIGEIVNALRQTYHTNCFLCGHCHQPIGAGSFHTEEGKIYCKKDWAALFQTKCHGCEFPIEPGDRWVEALGGNWHSECFNCCTCQVNLEGQSFFAKSGKPYCKKHAQGGRY